MPDFPASDVFLYKDNTILYVRKKDDTNAEWPAIYRATFMTTSHSNLDIKKLGDPIGNQASQQTIYMYKDIIKGLYFVKSSGAGSSSISSSEKKRYTLTQDEIQDIQQSRNKGFTLLEDRINVSSQMYWNMQEYDELELEGTIFQSMNSRLCVKQAEIARSDRDRQTHYMYEKQLYEAIRRCSSPFLTKILQIHEERTFVTIFSVFMEYFPMGDAFVASANGTIIFNIFFNDVLCGVRHLHDIGFYHRDIKLENIFVWKNGANQRYKLGDFGIAKPKYISKHPDLLGSRFYKCPHEYYDSNYTIQHMCDYGYVSDLYAAGVCFLACVLKHRFPWHIDENEIVPTMNEPCSQYMHFLKNGGPAPLFLSFITNDANGATIDQVNDYFRYEVFHWMNIVRRSKRGRRSW